MLKSGTQLVEEYAIGTPHDRFILIYKNYCIFPAVIENYEHNIFKRIVAEKEYNSKKRSANLDELGVKVQASRSLSDITSKKAINNVMIKEAIQMGAISDELLEDTDNADKHTQDILTIQMMKEHLKEFNMQLKALDPKSYRITKRFICREAKCEQIAEDEQLAYQTLRNLLYQTRKNLEGEVIKSIKY